MGLLIECHICKTRSPLKAAACKKCGVSFRKIGGRVYWIEYYDGQGNRRRERIGPSKAAAAQRLREILKLRAEGRYINKDKNAAVTFDELAKWYLQLPQVKAKKSYARDVLAMRSLQSFFSGKHIKDITVNQVEAYRQKRLGEDSYRKHKTRPATVNREMACLKYLLNLAEREGKIERLPFKGLKALKENNVRNRILSDDEYHRLIAQCPPHTARVVKMAYYTAMRQGEILGLQWDRVDLKEGVVRLRPEDTKTNEGRVVPLHPELLEMIRSMPRTIHGRVFTMEGRPLTEIKKSFRTACKEAGIEGLTFHDLRHTCINNWRLKGHDFFRIMAASGHKTMEVFKRYNTVTEEEVKKLVSGPMDTYMDTKAEKELSRVG